MNSFEIINLNLIEKLKDNFTIYEGPFDTSDDGKLVKIEIKGTTIEFNIESIVNAQNKALLDMSEQELHQISTGSKTKIEMLAGGVYAERLDLKKYAPNTSYFGYGYDLSETRYLICIAFDEMQPTIYEAQLIAVFKVIPD